jgi:hypothetical protein
LGVGFCAICAELFHCYTELGDRCTRQRSPAKLVKNLGSNRAKIPELSDDFLQSGQGLATLCPYRSFYKISLQNQKILQNAIRAVTAALF